MARSLAGILLLALGACSGSEGVAGDPVADAPRLPGDSAAAAAGAEAVVAPEVPADAPLVAVLGDSVAAGLHLAAGEAFPAVLQRELADAGSPFRLVNAGVSGDTTAGGLRRVDWLLGQEPDVVVIELGNNDGLRGQPAAAIEANLRAIVERCREAGAAVLLLGVRLPPSLGRTYVEEVEAVYPRLAEELGLAFVPSFLEGVGGVPELNLPDGIHPTAEGHRRVASRVGPALRDLLERLAHGSPEAR